MDKFFSSVQNFFQSVTSNDRYADVESSNSSSNYGRRTVSGGFGPRAPLTSAEGSDLSHGSHNPYGAYSSNPSSRNGSSTTLSASASNTSLNRAPYTPGSRSARLGAAANHGANGIPLQDYNDGAPPPPPPALSWKRIDRWLEAAYPELADQLEDPVTAKDLNEFEADLGFNLPGDVRDSFLIYDGQERGSKPTGVIFGLTLLDLEAVAAEWENWKNTAIRVGNMAKAAQVNKLQQQQQQLHQTKYGPGAAGPGPSSAASSQSPPPRRPGKPGPRNGGNLTWLDYQESVPEGAIQRVYAHPGWIPLVTDYLGNNIAIDLAPGPTGKWGQVILFGREFDRKFVVASSWSAFLLMFADDLENGRHLVEDETEEGVFLFTAPNGRNIPYFDVLRSRAERKYKGPARQQQRPPANKHYPQGQGQGQGQQQGSSPYGMNRNNSNPNFANSSPRNSLGGHSAAAAPGRNVSSGLRPQNGRPTPISTSGGGLSGPAGQRLASEGKLISPMSSSSNLPSASITKSSIPPSVSLTSSLTTTASPDETSLGEQSDALADIIDEEAEPAKEPEESKENAENKSDTQDEESNEIAKDVEVPTTVEEEEPKSNGSEDATTSSATEDADKISLEEPKYEIADSHDESEDEVDLLRDELTEVAI